MNIDNIKFGIVNGEKCWRVDNFPYKITDNWIVGDHMEYGSSMWMTPNNIPICPDCLSYNVYEEKGGIDWGGFHCKDCDTHYYDEGYDYFIKFKNFFTNNPQIVEEKCVKTYVKGIVRYEKDWCLLEVDQSILKNIKGIDDLIITNKLHISIIKNELSRKSKNFHKWEKYKNGEEVVFSFDGTISNNGLHNWVNCESDELCKIRQFFDTPTLYNNENDSYPVLFHMTIGKFKNPIPYEKESEIRITSRTHINPKTGIQHI